MVSPIGRTKGMTLRGKGNVVLVAAQLDDADGNPTEEYVLLRADEFGRLRTIDAGAVATFLGLTDTPGSYLGQGLLTLRVNAAEDAIEFVASTSHAPTMPQMDDVGQSTWGHPGWGHHAVGNSSIVVDFLEYVPIYVERARTFTQIGVHVLGPDVAGTVCRLGIYAATFDGDGELTPGALTLDAGTVLADAAGLQSIAISQALAEGFHFLAISSDGTPALVHPDPGTAVWISVTSRASVINVTSTSCLGVAVGDGAAALPSPATAPTNNREIDAARVWIGD